MNDTIKLGDIVEDGTLMIREINQQKVNEYAEAMTLGEVFPPMKVDKKSKRLVCGFHRNKGYQIVYNPEEEINVEYKDYKDEAEMLLDAYSDNRKNGLPLSPWDRKKGVFRLKQHNIPEKIIRLTLGLTEERWNKWDADTIIVLNEDSGKKEEKPKKGGLNQIEEVSEKVYSNIEKHYSGWNVTFHAKQILMHINDETINKENEKQNMIMVELYTALKLYLKGI